MYCIPVILALGMCSKEAETSCRIPKYWHSKESSTLTLEVVNRKFCLNNAGGNINKRLSFFQLRSHEPYRKIYEKKL